MEQEDAVSRNSNVTNTPCDAFLQRFAHYLDQERGLCLASIVQHRRIANRLINDCFGVGPMDWSRIEATAIRSFFRFISPELPERGGQIQRILAIPAKRQPHPLVHFLLPSEAEALLAAPDCSKWLGAVITR